MYILGYMYINMQPKYTLGPVCLIYIFFGASNCLDPPMDALIQLHEPKRTRPKAIAMAYW